MAVIDAGRIYVEHARFAVAFGERAMRSAKATHHGTENVLQVEKAPDFDPILIEILSQFGFPYIRNWK
jgi:hypothetical protein